MLYNPNFVKQGKNIIATGCLINTAPTDSSAIMGLDNKLNTAYLNTVGTRTVGVVGGASVDQAYVHWYDGIFNIWKKVFITKKL